MCDAFICYCVPPMALPDSYYRLINSYAQTLVMQAHGLLPAILKSSTSVSWVNL